MDFLRFFGIGKNRITVYAFYGPSGTGKSYRAKLVARRNGIRVLIDDGLLIQDEKILAGKSAKMEQNYMGAVRTALFDSKDHRDEVAKAIAANRVRKILILGTSEKMVNKIALRLQLPLPEKYMQIQDIATPEQMEEARRSRMIEGKHIIPVREHEIKKKISSNIFVDSIHVALARRKLLSRLLAAFAPAKAAPPEPSRHFEKSVVRPAFAVPKRKEISHAALCRMAVQYFGEYHASLRIKRMDVTSIDTGYTLSMTVDVPFGVPQLVEFISSAKKFATEKIEKESGAFIKEIAVSIDKVLPPPKTTA